MSWREHWKNVKSSVAHGDVISGCRDNDTGSYRLFVNKGWRELDRGYIFDSSACCDLSLEDLQALVAVLQGAIAKHKPWPDMSDE